MIRHVLLASALLSAAPKPVFTDAAVTLLGTPSPDGKYLSLVENGNLAIREITTGRSTRLTQAQGKEFAYFSAISRDARTVAYAWFNDEGFYELRSVPITGGKPVTLFRNPEAGFVQPCSWTPGNDFILTLLFRKDNVSQIALVPAAGGEAKILRSLNWVYPKRMDIAPDGKTLLYDSFAPGSTSQRTIYSLTLDGAVEKRLVTEPGNHLFPLYAPDGKSFYYLSDDNLVQRQFSGAERVVERGIGRALPLGITSGGLLYYGLRTGYSDVFLADIHNIAKTARRASLQFPNRNLAPAFSPDGNRLAYLSRRGTENFGQESRVVVVRDLSSTAEFELAARMAHIEKVRWRADGAALLLLGSDGRGRGGVFEFDLATGRTRPIAAEIGGPHRGYDAVSTKDGIFYLDGNRLIQAGGKVVHEGRNLKSIAATSTGELAVYDENAIVFPVSGKQIILDGITELIGGPARLHAIRAGKLVRLQPTEELPFPGNAHPGASISPDGKTIALTAGRESQEIWVLELGPSKEPAAPK